MPHVELKLGDMFDGPADLIVLPCSTSGTITTMVRRRLVHHRIPYPAPGMELGDVNVMPFEGGENIAQYVAFAASVENDDSNKQAIRRIGKQLGSVTNEQRTIRRVAAPLLGAGAGGLQSEVVLAALSEGFKTTAHRDASLIIHVLHADVFYRLSDGLREMLDHEDRPTSGPLHTSPPVPEGPAMRIFISYCHTSPDHEQWVEQLGTFLRENGLDARLDIWHLRRGMDLPQFMTNELALAGRVIIISDERYAEKADGRVGGVGWETMIVQGDMSQLPPDSTKYLVIVRSQSLDDGLPRYLRTKFVVHWPGATTDTSNRKLLLEELYNISKVPPLGRRPVFL